MRAGRGTTIRALAAPVALALAVVLVAADAADATFPGRNGPLALTQFETDREKADLSSIALITPRGRRLRRLAICAATSVDCPSSPSFSRDGRRFAYDSGAFAPTGTRLVVAPADGGKPFVLPQLTESDSEPAWSPDGRRLVFTGRTRRGRDIDLYLVRPDGTGLRRLTREGGFDPSWSSRNRIAFVREDAIHVVRPGAETTRKIATGLHPDWSPSGRSLAYDLRGRVYTVPIQPPAGQVRRRRLVLRRAEKPTWSPDGRRIALLRPPGDVPSDLYLVRSDGTGLKRIYRTRARADSSFSSVLDVAWARRR